MSKLTDEEKINNQRLCDTCNTLKDAKSFGWHQLKSGEMSYRNTCTYCCNRKQYRRGKYNGAYDLKKKSMRRHDINQIPYYILKDSLLYDKKYNFDNDLTIDFIKNFIKDGCFYCGEAERRIGLDRIDNDTGHLQNNVHPCCLRCNFLRRKMPYEAWELLVPAVKEARERGLFKDWTGGFDTHKIYNQEKIYKDCNFCKKSVHLFLDNENGQSFCSRHCLNKAAYRDSWPSGDELLSLYEKFGTYKDLATHLNKNVTSVRDLIQELKKGVNNF